MSCEWSTEDHTMSCEWSTEDHTMSCEWSTEDQTYDHGLSHLDLSTGSSLSK